MRREAPGQIWEALEGLGRVWSPGEGALGQDEPEGGGVACP